MQKIKVLPPEEIQKIAAGEVVERPASVVKELLENALDAQSTLISLYIEKSGKQKIRIVDNGVGMSPEDAAFCFIPHATSKISAVDDVENVSTFGFRGEALAAIASVSKVTLITRQASEIVATKIIIEGGKQVGSEELSAPVGSDFSIESLFFNTPARKKFLKNDETEWNAIQSYFFSFALQRCDVSFSLYRDGKRVVHAPATATLQERVGQLFGRSLAEQCLSLWVDENRKGVEVRGLISHQHAWRYSRSHIFLFVNNRPVKNSGLFKALYKGYDNSLPQGRFPLAFIFISVDSSSVDVNVHPRKEEVAFSKPGHVESVVQSHVTKTLEQRVSNSFIPKQDVSFSTQPSTASSYSSFGSPSVSFEKSAPGFPPILPTRSMENFFFEEQKSSLPVEDVSHVISDHNSFQVIGTLFQTYIVIEQNNEVLIIDQHAAHERILYEQFASHFEKREGTRLIFPEIVEVGKRHLSLLLQEKEFFEMQGIELDSMGEGELIISTAPPRLHNQSLRSFIQEIATYMEEHEHLAHDQFKKQLREHVHSHMACKAAIKAGDILSVQEIQELIAKLLKTPNRHICVHGRPTLWTISRLELEKKFKRKN